MKNVNIYKNREDLFEDFYFVKMVIKKYSHNGSRKSVPLDIFGWSIYKCQHDSIRNKSILYLFIFIFSLNVLGDIG